MSKELPPHWGEVEAFLAKAPPGITLVNAPCYLSIDPRHSQCVSYYWLLFRHVFTGCRQDVRGDVPDRSDSASQGLALLINKANPYNLEIGVLFG